MFTLGGISGVMLAMVPLDIHVSDTYFIVAHIHFVLFGGSVFTIFAGIYYWFPKMTGRMYNERLGQAPLLADVMIFNITFTPMHLIGVQGMPRRVVRLRRAVRNLEPDHLGRLVRRRALHADLPLQHDRLVAHRVRRPATTHGAR